MAVILCIYNHTLANSAGMGPPLVVAPKLDTVCYFIKQMSWWMGFVVLSISLLQPMISYHRP